MHWRLPGTTQLHWHLKLRWFTCKLQEKGRLVLSVPLTNNFCNAGFWSFHPHLYSSGTEKFPLLYEQTDWLSNQPTNSMEQSSFWETNSTPASQEILCISWNTKVHHHIHNSPGLFLFWSNQSSQCPLPISLKFILILSFHLCLGLPSSLFLAVFPIKNYSYIYISQTGPILSEESLSDRNYYWLFFLTVLHRLTFFICNWFMHFLIYLETLRDSSTLSYTMTMN